MSSWVKLAGRVVTGGRRLLRAHLVELLGEEVLARCDRLVIAGRDEPHPDLYQLTSWVSGWVMREVPARSFMLHHVSGLGLPTPLTERSILPLTSERRGHPAAREAREVVEELVLFATRWAVPLAGCQRFTISAHAEPESSPVACMVFLIDGRGVRPSPAADSRSRRCS